MKKYILLILVLFVVGCTAPQEAPIAPSDPLPPADENVDVPVEEPVEEPGEPSLPPDETDVVAPEVKEEEVPHDNKLREGYVDLENFKGSAEDILFAYLDKLDDEQFEKTQQRKYMKMDLKYEGYAQIYYPKWQELSKEFLEEEAEMIGNVWAQANAGVSQYFEAALHDYRGVKVGKVVVKKGEVIVTVE